MSGIEIVQTGKDVGTFFNAWVTYVNSAQHVPAPVVWTRFCSSGGQLHQLVLTGFKG